MAQAARFGLLPEGAWENGPNGLGESMSGEILMKYAVLFAFFSAAVAMGQDRAEPGRPKHIVGGEDTMTGEFPFVAKIIYGGYQVGCTGSLITPDKVLTAGHCVSGFRNLSVLTAGHCVSGFRNLCSRQATACRAIAMDMGSRGV